MLRVVLPTHDRSDALDETVGCLGKQTSPDGWQWELVVGNNNSTQLLDHWAPLRSPRQS